MPGLEAADVSPVLWSAEAAELAVSVNIQELASRIRSALFVLALMEETGASDAALIQQRDYVRGLRAELNQQCPDGEYDPNLRNVVEKV